MKTNMTLRLAYMTGEYPRATDTFIQREIDSLRRLGAHVETFSIRKPADHQTVSEQQRTERGRTFYILAQSLLTILGANIGQFANHPIRYVIALGEAWRSAAPGWRGLLYQGFYFLEAALLAREMKRRNLTHLHNHFADSSCNTAMLAAAIGAFTYSFTLHGPMIFFEPHRWRLNRKIARARFVVCISHYCKSQAMIFSQPRDWAKLHIVHCGVEPAAFEPVEHTRQGKRMIYVGRLANVKGLPVMLDALAQVKKQLNEVELLLIGDGPDRTALEAQSKQLGLSDQVRFLGYQSPEQVREYLQQCDLFVMSSFAEGVPVVLMEAMAVGLPVIATHIAGVSELVEDNVSGFLVPPGDGNTLAKRILTLLNDAQRRSTFANAGRQKVKSEFNLNIETTRLHALFKNGTPPSSNQETK